MISNKRMKIDNVSLCKRGGQQQKYSNTKIEQFLKVLQRKQPSLTEIDVKKISSQITVGNEITSEKLANHVAELAASLAIKHWQYGKLGGRIVVSMIHKNTPNTFVESMMVLQGT
jgi:hypothetical protein